MASSANPSTRRRFAGGGAPSSTVPARHKSYNHHRHRHGQHAAANAVDPDALSAAHQASSITSSLLRTRDMMTREIERTALLDTTINDDGALLVETKCEHVGMGGTMRGARGVMRKLGRQDVRDAIILRCSVAIYWCVVAYVLWSRIKVPFLP